MLSLHISQVSSGWAGVERQSSGDLTARHDPRRTRRCEPPNTPKITKVEFLGSSIVFAALYGVDNTSNLLRFDSATPDVIDAPVHRGESDRLISHRRRVGWLRSAPAAIIFSAHSRPSYFDTQESRGMLRVIDEMEIADLHSSRRASAGLGDGHACHEWTRHSAVHTAREIRPWTCGVVRALNDDDAVGIGDETGEIDRESAVENG